jgi:hypothetical protein
MLNFKSQNKTYLSPIINNKKAQTTLGTTLTWLVATGIIFAILAMFFFFALTLSYTKAIKPGDLQTVFADKTSQVLTEKTAIAYRIKDYNKDEINKILLKENGK